MKHVTKDGKEFDSLKEARAHEKSLRPTPRARSTDALPQDLVSIALKHPHGDLAAQVITLSNQIRARRKHLPKAYACSAEHIPCAAEQDFPA